MQTSVRPRAAVACGRTPFIPATDSPPRTWHPLASQECHRPRWPQTGHAGPESRWPSCAWRREPRRAGSRVFPGSLSLARRSPNLRAHPWLSPLSPPISKEPEVGSRPRPGSWCPPPIAPPAPPTVAMAPTFPTPAPGPARSPPVLVSVSLSPPRRCHFLPPPGSGSHSLFPVPLLVRSFGCEVRCGPETMPSPGPAPSPRGPRPVPTRDVGASSVVVLQRFLLSPGTRHF